MLSDILKAIQILNQARGMAVEVMQAFTKISAWVVLSEAMIDAETDFEKVNELTALQTSVILKLLGPIIGKKLTDATSVASWFGLSQEQVDEFITYLSASSENLDKLHRKNAVQNFEKKTADLYDDFNRVYENTNGMVEFKEQGKVVLKAKNSLHDFELHNQDYALYAMLTGRSDGPATAKEIKVVAGSRKAQETITKQYITPSGKSPREQYHTAMQSYISHGGVEVASRPTWVTLGSKTAVLASKGMQKHWKDHNEVRAAAGVVAKSIVLVKPDAEKILTTLKEEANYFSAVNKAMSQRVTNRDNKTEVDTYCRAHKTHTSDISYTAMTLMMAASVRLKFKAENRGHEIQDMNIYRLASLAMHDDFIEADVDELIDEMERLSEEHNLEVEPIEDIDKILKETEKSGAEEFDELVKAFNRYGTLLENEHERKIVFSDGHVQEYLVAEEKYLLNLIVQTSLMLSKNLISPGSVAQVNERLVELSGQLLKLRANRAWPQLLPANSLVNMFNRESSGDIHKVEDINAIQEQLKSLDIKIKEKNKKESEGDAQSALNKFRQEEKKKGLKEELSRVATAIEQVGGDDYDVAQSASFSLVRKLIIRSQEHLDKIGSNRDIALGKKTDDTRLEQVEHLSGVVLGLGLLLEHDSLEETVKNAALQLIEIQSKLDEMANNLNENDPELDSKLKKLDELILKRDTYLILFEQAEADLKEAPPIGQVIAQIEKSAAAHDKHTQKNDHKILPKVQQALAQDKKQQEQNRSDDKNKTDERPDSPKTALRRAKDFLGNQFSRASSRTGAYSPDNSSPRNSPPSSPTIGSETITSGSPAPLKRTKNN